MRLLHLGELGSVVSIALMLTSLGACAAASEGDTGEDGGALDPKHDGGPRDDASPGEDTAGHPPDEDTGVGAHDGSSETTPDGGAHDDAGDDTTPPPPPTGGFVHPGIMVDGRQLAFVKAKIAAGTAPWKGALDAAKGSAWAKSTYTAKPRESVDCGSYSTPDYGCTDEKSDAIAAYTQALLWALTGEEAYAKKSAEILDAWSSTVKKHTLANAPLQSAWVGSVFPRAGELLKHTWTGWPAANQARFAKMLTDVYLPLVVKGDIETNGNWELSMIEATVDIAVFTDDRKLFDGAVAMWRKRVPAYIYLTSDGTTPVKPAGSTKSASDLTKYWYSPGKFVDGLVQETCRDYGHLEYGLAAMFNAAQTATIQGVDLFQAEQHRIAAALEFNTQYLDGVANPGWLCGGSFTDLKNGETWELAYAAIGIRLGVSLPHTKNVVEKNRPTGADHHMVWETLTHVE